MKLEQKPTLQYLQREAFFAFNKKYISLINVDEYYMFDLFTTQQDIHLYHGDQKIHLNRTEILVTLNYFLYNLR